MSDCVSPKESKQPNLPAHTSHTSKKMLIWKPIQDPQNQIVLLWIMAVFYLITSIFDWWKLISLIIDNYKLPPDYKNSQLGCVIFQLDRT